MKKGGEASPPYLVFMLVLSVLAVVALALTAFVDLTPETRAILDYADTVLCALFFIDFLITLARSRDRGRYMYTWGWLDLVSSIPSVNSLRWARAVRIARILRVLRGIRAARTLTAFVLHRRAQNTFLAALLVSILLIVLSSATVLQFEPSDGANIKNPEDALWWAVVTITTVGYGDRYPVSSEGRLMAAILMTAGVGLFGTFSGFVASWFLQPLEAKSNDDLARLTEEIAKLNDAVALLASREKR